MMIGFSSIKAKFLKVSKDWAVAGLCWLLSIAYMPMIINIVRYCFSEIFSTSSPFSFFATIPDPSISILRKTLDLATLTYGIITLISLESFFLISAIKETVLTLRKVRREAANQRDLNILGNSYSITAAPTKIIEPFTKEEIQSIESYLKNTKDAHKIKLYHLLRENLFSPLCSTSLNKMAKEKCCFDKTKTEKIPYGNQLRVGSNDEEHTKPNSFIIAVQTRVENDIKAFSIYIAQDKSEMRNAITHTAGCFPTVGKENKYKISPEDTVFYAINYLPSQVAEELSAKKSNNDDEGSNYFTCQIFEDLKKEFDKILKEVNLQKTYEQKINLKSKLALNPLSTGFSQAFGLFSSFFKKNKNSHQDDKINSPKPPGMH